MDQICKSHLIEHLLSNIRSPRLTTYRTILPSGTIVLGIKEDQFFHSSVRTICSYKIKPPPCLLLLVDEGEALRRFVASLVREFEAADGGLPASKSCVRSPMSLLPWQRSAFSRGRRVRSCARRAFDGGAPSLRISAFPTAGVHPALSPLRGSLRSGDMSLGTRPLAIPDFATLPIYPTLRRT